MIPPIDSALTATWDYHKYLPLRNFPDRYGKVKNIRDFCFKTQIVQYEQYRALQEAFNYKMWIGIPGCLYGKIKTHGQPCVVRSTIIISIAMAVTSVTNMLLRRYTFN